MNFKNKIPGVIKYKDVNVSKSPNFNSKLYFIKNIKSLRIV